MLLVLLVTFKGYVLWTQHKFILVHVFLIGLTEHTLKTTSIAVGALNKGRSTDTDYDDDLLGFLGVESIADVTFFSRLQIADVVFHSRAYKRVSRRNNYTIAYWQEGSICYGQIEVFFFTRDERRNGLWGCCCYNVNVWSTPL